MTPQLPSFLRRRLRLSEARRALLGGEPEVALECLSDPCLHLSDEADRLRERVLDVLCREAARHDLEGSPGEAERLLDLVATRDERRAGLWRHRLRREESSPSASPPSGLTPAAESGIIGALEKLLEEMRDDRTRSGVRRRDAPSSGEERPGAAGSRPEHAARLGEGGRRFLLAVDDAGELLVAWGGEITLGHTRAGVADLPFLADLDPVHALLSRTESFHAGPTWRIEPAKHQRVAIGGQLVDPGGATLGDGDEVQLASNLAFRFRRPHPASGSALLELLHGAECEGARQVLLFAPGEAGRIRMSASRGRHLRVPRLSEEVSLWIDGEELVVESRARLGARGAEAAIQAPRDGAPGGLRVPCPPARRIDFDVGSATSSGPPLGFSVRPLERRGSGEAWR